MSEDFLIRHCSPTLAGIKTGSLFSCDCPYKEELTEKLSGLNRKLVPKGVRILPLRICTGRALIYAYRPRALKNDFSDRRAGTLLKKYGYDPEKPNMCVTHLIRRIMSEEEFPHEIGLFLSYPPEDVSGFIRNRASGHKFAGYWKVYGNEHEAKTTFAKYDTCSRILFRQWQMGRSIEDLTVSDRH